MSLPPGTRIGPYEVHGLVGAGGMGEVYRARDARLGRDVAIKALPLALAHDSERLVRFEREARVLASLNHPNIAGIHGLEEADGKRYLVLEFVEGQTLSRRLSQGALPIDEALQVCRDIAAGVEAAHEGGVVHRDLKPGNVMLTSAGAVKVVDFGLAQSGNATGDGGSDPNLSASPTVTYAATQAGIVLGTAAYMSPEQARGKSVDRRTDIWSFGCVLYECLCGRPVFEGETVSDLIACILEREPDWNALPPRTPSRVRWLLQRCLTKNPKQRLRDIGDARLELDQVLVLGISGSLAEPGEFGAAKGWRLPWWSVIAVALVAVGATLLVQGKTRPSHTLTSRRFEISAPKSTTISFDPVENALSPDGRTLAMVLADSAEIPRLWVRPIDSFKARQLPGTKNVTQPFWSPDSRSLGFFADNKLKKIAVAGGDPEVLADIRTPRGGAWSKSGVILLAPTSNGPLFTIPAGGGELKAVTQLDSTRQETAHRAPHFLPDGRHYLFSVLHARGGGYSIQLGTIGESKRTEIMTAESGVAYAPPGYLLFTRKGVLCAQRFDPGSFKLSGDPVSLGDSPTVSSASGSTVVTAANDGTLAYTYIPLPSIRLAWFDTDGREVQRIPLLPGAYLGMSLSPDERSALVIRATSYTRNELLVVDLERGTANRLSSEEENVDGGWEWSPDGKRVAYMVSNLGPQSIVVAPADGSAPGETVLPAGENFRALDGWSPDGKSILYEQLDPETNFDLWVLPLEGAREPHPYLKSPANERSGRISPDGRWLSYNSDVSGRNEGYVQSFPTPGRRYQVTTDGSGVWGWKKIDGKALGLLPTGDGTARVVDVLPGSEFRVGPPRVMWKLPEVFTGVDVSNDWKRSFLAIPVGKATEPAIRIVLDWTEMLAGR